MPRPERTDDWTLFLDRDGVLNRRLVGDYVQRPADFEWLPGVLRALQVLRKRFARMVIVTNQQGIGKGLMSEGDLSRVHDRLQTDAAAFGVGFDGIYHCPALAIDRDPCRKPGPGMALQARRDYPEIDFARSVMVGDSPSDVGFGESLGMYTVGITTMHTSTAAREDYGSLLAFSRAWFGEP